MQKIRSIIVVLIVITVLIVMPSIVIASDIPSALEEAAKQAIETFNSKFKSYEGVQTGVGAKALVTAIQSNNASNGNRSIEVKGVATAPEFALQKIDVQKQYMVEFEYGEDGYIKAANIVEYVSIGEIPSNNTVQDPGITSGNIQTEIPVNDINTANSKNEEDLPETGVFTIINGFILFSVISLIAYFRYKKFKDVDEY